MIEAEAVLYAPLELAPVATAILASLRAATVALTIRPFPGVNIARVESIDSVTISQAPSILSSVAATSSPSLNPKSIVLAIDPLSFVPSTHVKVIHPAPRALALVELSLVNIPIAVSLHSFSVQFLLILLWFG